MTTLAKSIVGCALILAGSVALAGLPGAMIVVGIYLISDMPDRWSRRLAEIRDLLRRYPFDY